jgi:hypothetical protein
MIKVKCNYKTKNLYDKLQAYSNITVEHLTQKNNSELFIYLKDGTYVNIKECTTNYSLANLLKKAKLRIINKTLIEVNQNKGIKLFTYEVSKFKKLKERIENRSNFSRLTKCT